MIAKYIKWTLGTIGFAAAMLFAKKSHGADAEGFARFVDSFTAAPVVAIQTAGITGESQLGAGVDLGVGVNKYVSLHVTALTLESEDWKSGVVDESEAYAKARFVSYAKEAFLLYGKGGAVRQWTQDDWGFGVGLGAELALNKHVSIASDYTIRAWFNGSEKDSLARLLVNFSF